MNVSKEFLLEAVGLSLLVMLLLLGVNVFERGVRLITLVEERQEKKISALEEYEITRYDGLEIDGVTARNYIRQMVTEYGLPVILQGERDGISIETKEECALLREMETSYYVAPMALYECSVIRDENESVSGVWIGRVQEGEGEYE